MSKFESFCSRMWLDHCDENKTLYSNPLTYEEYVKRNWIWLLDKYSERKEKDNEPTKQ